MVFTRGQTDRFGRPIPASPGYQVLINEDGSEVQQRNRLILPASLVATDSEDNDATELTLSSSPADITLAANSVLGNDTGSSAPGTSKSATAIGFGVLAAATQAALTALIAVATQALSGLMSAADKTIVDQGWKKIEGTIACAEQAIGTRATATWTAGTYKQVKLVIRQYATVNSSGINNFTMVGCTGTYKSSVIYVGGGGPASYSGSATAYVGWAGGIARGEFTFDIPALPKLKGMTGISNIQSTTPAQLQVHGADNDDTTHEVTGLGIVTINDVTSFSYELYGLPA